MVPRPDPPGANARWAVCRLAAVLAVCAAFSTTTGCNRGPSRLAAPDWDPSGLAERIMADFDKNGDAQLDEQELAAAPGLAAGVSVLDADKNGVLTAAEIESQFELNRQQRVGLKTPTFRVTYNNRPVAGAEVKFVPEPFLEGVIEPAVGTTDAAGMVTPQTEGQNLLGMRLGYYRVQVISPKVKIPEKYAGAETTLGADVSLVQNGYGAPSATQLKLTD